MTLAHLLIAAAAVGIWFIGWGWAVARIGWTATRPHLMTEGVESVLLTMFAALWFGSLGHGGWWVLFLVVGLLIEGPARTRHREAALPEPMSWRPLVLGVIRIFGAGALLALLL